MNRQMKKSIFLLLSALVVVLGCLHYWTPGHHIFLHDTYRRLGYFPITIGGIIFGLWGGLFFAVISCLAFVPHLYMFWAQGPEAYYSELSEILFYLIAGLVVGLISSRQARLREKYRGLSEKLSVSYQRLHDQTRQLLQIEEQLSSNQRLSLLGQVSASLAHEIKNPLAAIKGAAEILADEVPKGHDKYEFVTIMRSQISRLNQSVEKVLDFCRGEQKKDATQYNFQPVQVIVEEVLKLLDPQLRQHRIELITHIEPGENPVTVQSASLGQVLMNVLLNAIDAAGDNGKIRIQAEPDVTDAGLADKSQTQGRTPGYTIHVSDSGPGIPDNEEVQVFEPFFTRKDSGTGLGLSISRKLIESIGGTIMLDRSGLGGAGFLIRIPDHRDVSAKGVQDDTIHFVD